MKRIALFLCTVLSALTLTTAAHALEHPHVDREGESGNSDIKAGYSVYAGLLVCNEQDIERDNGLQATMPPFFPVMFPCVADADLQYLKLEAKARAWVKMFGREETIASAQAYARDEDGRKTSLVRLYAVGQTLFHQERDGVDIERGVSFTKSKKYGMSGINVTVRGTASAQVGINFNGGPVGDDVAIYATPYGDAGVSASASVGAGCASASIEGSLQAIEAEIPAELWVDIDPDEITFDIDADLELRLMSGKIKAELSYCLGNASKTIISRSANRFTQSLLNTTYTIDL